MKALNKLILHILQKEDLIGVIKTFTFPWSSLQATQEKWERYYTEQQTNIRTVCIAKIGDEFIGYGSLLKNSEYANFKNLGIPEINDIWGLSGISGEWIWQRIGSTSGGDCS